MGKSKRERTLKDNEAKAVLRMVRTSPQKLNLVAAQIRGEKVDRALAELEFSRKPMPRTTTVWIPTLWWFRKHSWARLW